MSEIERRYFNAILPRQSTTPGIGTTFLATSTTASVHDLDAYPDMFGKDLDFYAEGGKIWITASSDGATAINKAATPGATIAAGTLATTGAPLASGAIATACLDRVKDRYLHLQADSRDADAHHLPVLEGTDSLMWRRPRIASAGASGDFGTQNVTTTGYISVGTNPATVGAVRLGNLSNVVGRNATNTANYIMLQVDASNRVVVGDLAAGTGYLTMGQTSGDSLWVGIGEFTVQCGTSQLVTFKTGATSRWKYDATAIHTALPIIGFASVYSVHGSVSITFAADTNYTVLNTQYIYDTLTFVTGSWTLGRSTIWPHPATDAAGYEKTIVNSTTFTMTVSTGTGTTRTLTTGLGQRFRFAAGGVTAAGPTFTP